jgi:hypothetical protein
VKYVFVWTKKRWNIKDWGNCLHIEELYNFAPHLIFHGIMPRTMKCARHVIQTGKWENSSHGRIEETTWCTCF